MIPITLPRNTERRVTPTFQCVTCLGLFRRRPGSAGKRSCVDCEDLRVRAREAATRKVHDEIKAGRMKPATEYKCVDCNAPAKHYEHRDYSQPLWVDPVCRRCNRLRGPATL